MKRRKKKGTEIDILTLIMSIVFAVIWAVAGEFLYYCYHDVLWTPLLIGIYFLGLALMQLLSIQFCGVLRGRAAESKDIQKALAMILAVFAAALAMDFVYEQVSFNHSQPTSFIFVIDDSISMQGNDPRQQRVDAMLEVLDGCDPNFPFAVYAFDEKGKCDQMVAVTSASQARSIGFRFASDGGQTYIFDALNAVLDDISSGRLSGVGVNPRIVLLTDGESFDDTLDLTLAKAAACNTSICCVGFGDSENAMLNRISRGANGLSVHIDDVNHLSSAMLEAANAVTGDHDLLNYRTKLNQDWIYFLIRMAFVLVLGAMFLYIKAQLLRTNDQRLNVLPIHIVLLLLGGLCLEIGINLLRFDEFYMHCIMCILLLINVTGISNERRRGSFSTMAEGNRDNLYSGYGKDDFSGSQYSGSDGNDFSGSW